jgi:nickel transport protein
MDERPMASPRFAFRLRAMAFFAATLMASLPGAAQAHRLNIFAGADGTVIKGTVYFQGMIPARAAHVAVFDPKGALVTEMLTDENGRFAFGAGRRVDHRIVADLEDGHRAAFMVPAAQLPPTLPAGSPAGEAPASTTAAAEPMPEAPPAAIEAMVDAAVARHVGPLREQIAAYEDKIRWHDVLGGIGYIVGMSGIACYFLARRRGS